MPAPGPDVVASPVDVFSSSIFFLALSQVTRSVANALSSSASHERWTPKRAFSQATESLQPHADTPAIAQMGKPNLDPSIFDPVPWSPSKPLARCRRG